MLMWQMEGSEKSRIVEVATKNASGNIWMFFDIHTSELLFEFSVENFIVEDKIILFGFVEKEDNNYIKETIELTPVGAIK